MKKGRLIVFTGIDGSGKTTQANLLIESMKQDGINVTYVWSRWEPFFIRPLIKSWKNDVSKRTGNSSSDFNKMRSDKKKLMGNPVFRCLWLTAFFVDYGFQIFSKIRIKLLKNKLIVSDRMFYDSVIDQAVNLGERKEGLLESLDSFWMKIVFPLPDMVIYVDCPAEIAFTRKDDAPDEQYLIERRELYLKLADRYGWTKMDGTLSVNDIAAQIKNKVYNRFNFTACQK